MYTISIEYNTKLLYYAVKEVVAMLQIIILAVMALTITSLWLKSHKLMSILLCILASAILSFMI
jgi:hypothetical protein